MIFKRIIRLLFILIFALFGALFSKYFIVLLEEDYPLIFGFILVILLFSLIGFLVGGYLSKKLSEIVVKVEKVLIKIPGVDILIGIFGLLVGLIIASIISFPFLDSLGDYKTTYTFLSFFILGSGGLVISLYKRREFGVLVPMASGGEGQSFLSKILDTSAIIDGRIIDMYKTGFLEGKIIIPQFVLKELQGIADSDDFLKRNRGRRGLQVLEDFKKKALAKVEISNEDFPGRLDVDSKIVLLAKKLSASIITTDFNLNKIAELQEVKALNINDLANALKPIVIPGEELQIQVIRAGKEEGQGVGYLDDGTMVVVDGGEKLIGKEIIAVVTGILQTSAGRIVFTKPKEETV
ncbi:MAG: hypothetical protein KAS39_06875 [Actinomycetia bacterium]|nr:hypothetical protein [Actinomycetes bacterium]